jgi:hypothetical protein
MEKFSDISSAEETDNDNPVNTDVFKLFDYENEMEQSFSGFEKEQCNEASNSTINVKTLQNSRRLILNFRYINTTGRASTCKRFHILIKDSALFQKFGQ